MTRPELRVFLMKFFCGCGNPEEASRSLLRLMSLFADDAKGKPYQEFKAQLESLIPDIGIQNLMLYFLTELGLLEHGGGVFASWFTGKGDAVYEALKREEADGFEALHEMFCVHGYDVGDKDHSCAKADSAS